MAGVTTEVRCEICGEVLDLEDETHLGNGAFAEMFNPKNPVQNGIVHAQCGLSAGWEVS